MSSGEECVDVSEEAKQIVSEIIARNNLKGTPEIKYYPGSQAGDGYSGKTFIVDITDGETTLNLFLKCAFDIDRNTSTANNFYKTEIYFYKTIYPAYKEFLENKGVKDGFQEVPLCYGYSEKCRSEIVALENLRKKGYTLFDKSTFMNEEHLTLTLRSFAKFHAISFAMKDQRKELYDEFCEQCPDIFGQVAVDAVPKMVTNTVNDFIRKLDAVIDRDILDRCENLDVRVSDQFVNLNRLLTDYSILTKGDCWINNMMILYENDNREHPKDVMLIDWQTTVCASPVQDFLGLFYSVASPKAVDNYKHYMRIYHEELSRRIRELGSDPEVLYPRSVFEKDWIDRGLFALGLCLVLIKVMVAESKDAPVPENEGDMSEIAEMFTKRPHNEEEYMRRTKHVVRHMIDIGVI